MIEESMKLESKLGYVGGAIKEKLKQDLKEKITAEIVDPLLEKVVEEMCADIDFKSHLARSMDEYLEMKVDIVDRRTK